MAILLAFIFFTATPEDTYLDKFNIISSTVGFPLQDAIDRLDLKKDDFRFGGGAGDHFLQYCLMSDNEDNIFYLWVDVPMIPLPSIFDHKGRNQILQRIYDSIQQSNVFFISVINRSDYKPSPSNCKTPILSQFTGSRVSDVLSSIGLLDEKRVAVYNRIVRMYVLRVAARNGLIFELQVQPQKELNPKNIKRLKPIHLMGYPVHLLRVYSGLHTSLKLKGERLSLDGSRR